MKRLKILLFFFVMHFSWGASIGSIAFADKSPRNSLTTKTKKFSPNTTSNLVQTICESGAIDPIIIPLVNGANNADIQSNSGADISWLEIEITENQAVITGVSEINISQQNIYDFVIYTRSLNNSIIDQYQGEITVNPDGEISLDSGFTDQTVCQGELISPTVFTLGGGASEVIISSDSGAASWLSTSINGNSVVLTGITDFEVSTPTTYDYTVITTGSGCNSTGISGEITVNPKPSISNTNGLLAQDVCVGEPIETVIFNLINAETATVNGLPNGVLYSISGAFLTISGTPNDVSSNQTFTYTVEPKNTTSSCVGTPITGQITVNANGTLDNISNNANQTVCENSPISQITLSLGGGATGVSITSNSGANTWLNAVVNGNNVVVNGIPPADIDTQTKYDYTITTTGSNCVQGTSSGFITVNPEGELSPITSNTNQLICESNPIAPIRFRLSGGASLVNISSNSGADSWLNAAVDNNIVTVSGVPNSDIISQRYFDYTITTIGSNGCTEASFSGGITVNPAPSISYNENSGDINQAVCELSPIEDIIFNLSDGAQSAIVSGLPPGVTYNIVNNTVSLSGIPSDVTANTTFNYSVQPLNLLTNCLGESLGGSISVKTDGELNIVSANGTQAACSNNEIDPIIFQIGGTSELTLSSTNNITSWMNISPVSNGTISLTGIPINSSSESIIYDYLLTTSGENNCEQDTFSGSIRVDPSPTISNVTGVLNQSICEGEDISIITFELQGAQTANVTGLPAGITYAIENNTITISGTASDITSNQTFPYVVEPINIDTNCKGNPVEGSIEVNANGEISVTSSNRNQTICEGDSITPIQLIIGGGASDISITSNSGAEQWLNPDVNGTGFVIVGTPTEDISSQETYDYTITTTDSSCNEESISGVITVNPKPSIIYQSGLFNQTVCEGDAIGSIVFDLNGAQSANVTNLPSGVIYTINGATLTISGIPSDVTSNSTFDYLVEPININSNCAGTPVSGTIIVNADSKLMLTSENKNQTLCEGEFIEPIRLSLSGGATGVSITSTSIPPVDLNWLDALVLNGSVVITGSPGLDITTPTTFNYIITTTGGNCNEDDISGVLTFNPTPKVLHDANGGALSQTFCEGETITPIVFDLEGAQTATVAGLPAGIAYDISNTTLTISGTLSDVAANQNYSYSVQPININTNCIGTAITGLISVDADGEFSSVSPNKDQTLCEGEAIVPIELTLSGGATGVTITSTSGTDLWMDAVVNGNRVVITGTPDVNISVQEAYDYTITATGSNCITNEVQGIITVDPKPSIFQQSGALVQDVCEGESISPIQFQLQGAQSVNVNGLPAGISYAISGSLLTISGTPSNIDANRTFNFSIVPVNINTSCTGTPIEGAITVNADGALNVLSSNTNQIICEGTSIAPIQMVLSGGATDVTLTSTNGAELWLDVVVNENSVVISGTPIEDITSQKTYDYTITTTGSNCVPDSVQGTIKVNSQPAIEYTGGLLSQTVCEGQSITPITFELEAAQTVNLSGLPTGVSYDINGTTLTISGTPSDVTSETIYDYSITPIDINTNCSGAAITGRISVNADSDLTIISANKDQTLCEGESISPLELIIGGGATGIEISSSSGADAWLTPAINGRSVVITGTPGVDITTTTTYNYTITTTGSDCSEEDISGVLTFNPTPKVLHDTSGGALSQTFCEGETITPIVFDLEGAQTATVTGLPAGVTYSISGTTLTVSGTLSDVAANQDYTYSIQPVNINTNCTGTAISGLIKVNADGNLTITSANANQTLCEGEAITPIELTISGGATDITITSDSGADISWMNIIANENSYTIVGMPTVGISEVKTYDYSIKTTGSNCEEDIASGVGVITVNPLPNLSYDELTSPGAINQSLQEGEAIDDIIFELTDGAQNANVTGLPEGITYAITGSTLTISGTLSDVSSNYISTYTVAPININTTCTGTPVTGQISVFADGELTITSGNKDQTLCENEAMAPIELTIGGGATGISIEELSSPALDINWMIPVIDGSSVTITGTPGEDIPSTIVYNYKITTTGSNSASIEDSISGTITVNPEPSISVTSGSTSFAICEGETITNITFELLDGANTANVTGLPAGITYAIVGTTLTISGAPDDVSSNQPFSYSVEPVDSNTDCAGTAIIGVISIQADEELTITSGNTDQPLCEGEAITPINLTLGGGATDVVITSTSGAIPTAGNQLSTDLSWLNVIPSENGVTVTGTPSQDITQTTEYAYTVTTTGSSCGTPAEIQGRITVNPEPKVIYEASVTDSSGRTIDSGDLDQTICEGASIEDIVFTLEGTDSANVTGLPAGIVFDISGTTLTISGTTTNVNENDTFAYSIEPINSNTGCTGNALGGTITVNADGELTITSGNKDQELCEREAITPINLTLAGGATGVAITPTTGATFPSGSNISTDLSWMNIVPSENGVTITGTPSNDIPQTTQYAYTIETTGNSCNPATPIEGTITVNPTPKASYEATVTDSSGVVTNNGSISQTICEAGPINAIVYNLEGADSANVTGLPAGIVFDISGTTLTISGTTTNVNENDTFAYSIEPINSNTGCTGNSQGGTITVNADGELTITSGNKDQELCEGESITPINLTLGGGATDVVITSTSGAIPTAGNQLSTDLSWLNVIPSENGVTVTGTSSQDITQTTEYAYTVTTTGSSCGTPAEIQGRITVNPEPKVIYEASVTDSSGGTIDSGDLDQTICEGASIEDIVFTLEGTESANITGLPVGIVFDISGTTLTISGTPSGVAANQEFDYTIQPVNDTTGCTGNALGGTITVNADGELTITSGNKDQELCEGESIEPIVLALAGGATGVAIASASGADVSWMNALVSDTSVTITGAPGADIDITKEYDYTITTTGSSCGTPDEIQGTITVNPEPKVIYEASVTDSSGGTIDSGDLDQTICEGASIEDIVFTLEGTESANITGLPAGIVFDISGTTLTISGTPSGVAANQEFTYTIQPVNDTTECTGNALGGTITVNADGELTITSGNKDQELCEGESIEPIVLALAGGATGVAIASASGADVSWMNALVSDTSVTITGTPGADIDITKEYDYTITTTGSSCGTPAEIQGRITVNPEPKVIYEASVTDSSGGTIDSGDLDQTICEGASIEDIVFTLEGTESANITGLPAGIVFDISGTTLTISGTPSGVAANQEFTYTIQPVNDTTECTGNALGGTITVNADGELTITSGNKDQELCEGESIEPIVLALAGGATGVAIASASGADVSWMNALVSDTSVTITGTPGADIDITKEYDYTITTTGSSCGTPAEIQGRITVNPEPKVIYEASVTDSSGGTIDSGDLDQTICEGASIEDIVFTLEGTESVNVTGLPAGIVFDISGTTLTISGTPSGVAANQEFTYTIQPVNDTTECTGNALGGTITVNADGELTITSGNADQELCEGESIEPIVLALAGGATGVAIASASGADVSWMNALVSDTSVTITGTPGADIDITKEYDYTITTTGSSCGTPAEIQGTITVNPEPKVIYEASVTDSSGGTIDSGDLDQTICEGASIEDIVFTLEGTESANITGLPAGIVFDISGTTLTISGTPNGVAVNDVFNYTIEPINSVTNCVGVPVSGTITVNALHQLTSTSGNTDQPLCEGESIEPIVLTLAGGATDVVITANTAATTPSGSNISTDLSWMNISTSGTSVTITGAPSEDIDTTTEYAYIIETTGNSCTDATINGTITVNPTPKAIYDVSSGPTNQTICEGDATGITPIKFNLEGTKTANVTGLPGGVTHSISSTGVLTIQGTPNGVAVNDVFVYTIEPVNNITNCVGVPVSGTITVNALHQLTSTSGNTDQPLCEGESIEPIVLTLAGGATDVVITANTAATTPSGSNISTDLSWMNISTSGTSVTITGAPSEDIDTTTEYAYIIETTGNSCTDATINGTITVNPTPKAIYDVSSGPTNQTICEGDATGITPIKFNLEGTKTANVTGLPGGVTHSISSTGVLTIQGTPNGVAVNDVFNYTIEPINNITNCVGVPVSGTITVNALHQLTSTSGNTDQPLCEGESIEPIVLTLAGGATDVVITANTAATAPSGSNISTDLSWMNISTSGTSVTITGAPSEDIDTTTEYAYIIETTGNSCTDATINGTITVNPTPKAIYDVSSGPTNQTICEGDATGITPIKFNLEGTKTANVTGLPGGVTHSISSTGVLTIQGTPNGVAVNDVFNYTIEPINNITNCVGVPVSGTITVNALHQLTSTSGNTDQPLCEGESIEPIVLTLAGGATDVVITANTAATAPSGSNISTDLSWMNISTSGTSVTITGAPSEDIDTTTEYAYIIETTGNSCTDATINGTITVNPTPKAIYDVSSGPTNQTICEGDATGITPIKFNLEGTKTANVTGLPGGVTHSISSTGVLTIQGTPNGVAVNDVFVYTIEPVNNITNCVGVPVSGTITVNALHQLTSTSGNTDQPLCEGESIEPIVLTLAGGATDVVITANTAATTPSGSNISTDLSWMNISTSGTSVTITGAPSEDIDTTTEYAYIIETTGNSCTDATINGTITVNPTPKAIYDVSSGPTNQTICEGDATGITPIKFNLEGTKTANVTGLPGGVTHSISSTGVLTIQGTPNGVAVNDVFVYTIEPVNNITNCVGVPVSGTITVNALHQLTSTSGNTDQPLCEGESIEPIVLTLAGGATDVVITANTAATTPSGSNISTDLSWMNISTSGTSVTITGAPSEDIDTTTEYAYIIETTGNSCTDATINGTITVNPTPKAIYDVSSGPTNQTICEGDATGITPIKFNLEGTKTANVTGLPGGVTHSISSTGVLTIQGTPNGVAVNDVFNYTIEPINNITNCVGVPVSGTITVNALHQLTSTSGNTDQPLCEGESIEPIVLTLAGGATDVVITANTAATTPSGSNISTDLSWMNISTSGTSVTITGAPSEDIDTTTEYAYIIETTGNSCTDATINGTITVNPTPKIVYSSIVNNGNINQTICEGDAITDIVFELSDGAQTVNITGLPDGVSYSISPTGVLTITGIPNYNIRADRSFDYTIVPVNIDAACENVSSVSGKITIEAEGKVEHLSGGVFRISTNKYEQTLCEGQQIEKIEIRFSKDNPPSIENLPLGLDKLITGDRLEISGSLDEIDEHNFKVFYPNTASCPSSNEIKISIDNRSIFEISDIHYVDYSITNLLTLPTGTPNKTLVKNIACYGDGTGEIRVAIDGTYPPSGYMFELTGPNNFKIPPKSSGHFEKLFGGIYNIIVRKEGFSDCYKSISITITEPSSPLEIITDSLRNESCNGSDGEILITTTGGNIAFYNQYKWEFKGSSGWGPLQAGVAGQGTNYVTDLSEGEYRVTINQYELSTGQLMSCFTEEKFEIKAHALAFENLVVDSNYCDGTSGIVEAVIKSSNDDLTFIYDGVRVENINVELISTQDTFKTYQLKIVDPSLNKDINVKVIDAYGCSESKEIKSDDLKIVEPSFDTFDENGKQYVTKFRKGSEITFKMVDISNYEYVEWDFGDGSEILTVQKSDFPNVLKYEYDWEGKYQVTLKAYNKWGCYKSYSKEITIGKGYEILMPTVFTPNNDGINDKIQPVFSGVKEIEFYVFNSNGVMLFKKVLDEASIIALYASTATTEIKEWGWGGENSDPSMNYFVYKIVATLLDDEIVTDTGTFILLNR